MLSRLSRFRRGGGIIEGLVPLARSALAAGRIEAAASLSGLGGESAVDGVFVGDPSTSTSPTTTTSTSASLSARPFHSRSSSGGSSSSSQEQRRDSEQATMMHSRGNMLPFSSPSSSRLSLRRKNPASCYSTAAPSPRKLDDILKLDSLRDKTGEEIASIWTEFHRDDSKNRVGGTLSAAAYRTFAEHVSEAPMLVWPLRKEVPAAGGGSSGGGEKKEKGSEEEEGSKESGAGLVVLLSQAQLPHVLFTTVDEFRALGPDAPAHVVLTHYAELAESKGVVLWRADVVSPALLVSASAASPKSPASSSSSTATTAAGGEAGDDAKAPPPSTSSSTSSSSSSSSSDAARALVATAHALYADPEGRAHARAFNEAKGFDFGALMRYFGLVAP